MPPETAYYYDDRYRFVIENYNWAKPFSNYFPGIAGKWGVPLWVYYVSQGQAVCSMGVQDKDHAIMEFLSFNKACMAVGSTGFRTFLRTGDQSVYEPFCKVNDPQIQQKMLVSSHELEILETNHRLGLDFRVIYFPLVNQPTAGLVRILEIKNTGQEAVEFELIDGLPRLLPYGMTFEHAKVIARHIEGMMTVDDIQNIPLFRLKQTPADIERVGPISGGNFYFSFLPSGKLLEDNWWVDPFPIFGDLMQFDTPWSFEFHGLDRMMQEKQIRENRTPCAMTGLRTRLASGEMTTLQSILGFTPEEEHFPEWVSRITKKTVLQDIRKGNLELITAVKQMALTVSDEPLFDQYCQQTFLENVMRGGMPLTLQSKENSTRIYTYLRQNGDLERDYHWFILEPTYLSQGNSHYRNILQNRRMDAWFFPSVKDDNLIALANLIQLDGYNPLDVFGATYTVRDEEKAFSLLRRLVSKDEDYTHLCALIRRKFSPGRFIMSLENCRSRMNSDYEEILADLLPLCARNEIGGRYEGYWIDHWTYLLDMIEVTFMMVPDQMREILLEKRAYSFFDNPDIVQKRKDKIVSTPDGLRQYGAVYYDAEKAAMIQARSQDPARVRIQYGKGEIYTTTLLVKLLCILANRLASLDPRGIGSEMEAGKPGWCDSLNGLPGLFSSSLCEALEIIRAGRLIIRVFAQCQVSDQEVVGVYEELFDFIERLNQAVCKVLEPGAQSNRLQFWMESHDLLETYRDRVRLGIDGREESMTIGQMKTFISNSTAMLEKNLRDIPRDELFSPGGVPYTYFTNRPILHSSVEGEETPEKIGLDNAVEKLAAFEHHPLAPFLEGPVHYVRVFPHQAASIHKAVKHSPLFDPKLQMYRNCASLDDEPLEIGRIKAYTRGWLENQSIYTHMEYKWVLELFRAGLFSECFSEFRNLLIPFLDPKTYGRSTLDSCSFIVSSVFPDANLHGQAFQPHLSGMTCEFLNLWALMVAGKSPFYRKDDGQVEFKLDPALPGWLFTTSEKRIQYWENDREHQEVAIPVNCFAFKLFGSILVIYHNPKRQNTFGPQAVKPGAYHVRFRDGRELTVCDESQRIRLALAVRENQVARMDVFLE